MAAMVTSPDQAGPSRTATGEQQAQAAGHGGLDHHRAGDVRQRQLVLPWRTQMTAFMISGSSVAIGDSSRAVTAADRPSIGPTASSWCTKS